MPLYNNSSRTRTDLCCSRLRASTKEGSVDVGKQSASSICKLKAAKRTCQQPFTGALGTARLEKQSRSLLISSLSAANATDPPRARAVNPSPFCFCEPISFLLRGLPAVDTTRTGDWRPRGLVKAFICYLSQPRLPQQRPCARGERPKFVVATGQRRGGHLRTGRA